MGDEAKLNTAVIIRPDEPPVKALLEDHPKVYQEIVGGFFEGVPGNDFWMCVNEDGHALKLPFNPQATMFVRTRAVEVFRLVGTAVILGPLDGRGNPTNAPKSVLNYFGLED